MRILALIALPFFLILSTDSGYGASNRAKNDSIKPYRSFIVIEERTGVKLASENEDERIAPASLTKLMLSLIVLEKLKANEISLDEKIRVSKEASKMGGSQIYLKEGELFTLEELMKATLVASANDAAYAIAERLAQTAEDFVQLMNRKAKALGLTKTLYKSVHGLPRLSQTDTDLTTAKDVAILARELLKYPKILEWTSIKTETLRNGNLKIVNHNRLLTRMEGLVDGLKTGYLKICGYNIAVTAKKGDFRIIAVIMGSPTAKARDDFAMELINKTFSEWSLKELVREREIINKDIFLPDGKITKFKGMASSSFKYPVRKDGGHTPDMAVELSERIHGEIKEGQKLGEIVFRLEGTEIGKVDIVSPFDIPKANIVTRLIRRSGLNI
ncbi:MAG: D-alanyl-D-alanine carboxypeptidase [Desulfobacterota bacterium]|nr:D-alanyl-D-alanine carboxypeptidase [Thermodesulfobacteriota bacterium]MDW8002687.1 D-alanyl-D-alanine carboxypeptidase family protein [Deltaproteobacteria bacterium]